MKKKNLIGETYLLTLIKEIKSLLYKEILQEKQGKYIINSMLMFSLLLIAIVVFPFSKADIGEDTKNILYWVIIYFSATAGLSNVFVKESQRNTLLTLKLYYSPNAIILGKTIFNFVFLMFSVTIITFVYTELFSFDLKSIPSIFAVLSLSCLGIAFSGTLLSALISQVANQGSLFMIVGFPVLFPVFMISINATELIITSGNLPLDSILIIALYDLISISLSLLVFETIWEHS